MADEREGGGGSRLSAGLIGSGVLALALLVFVVQNTEDVEVTVFFWTFTGPLWLVLVVSIVVGLVALELATTVLRRTRRSKR